MSPENSHTIVESACHAWITVFNKIVHIAKDKSYLYNVA